VLVIEKAKAIALKLNNPARVTECIPTAHRINFRGADLTVVPHAPEEVRVLRNLGIKAPAPILHYYKWPGFTPYNHQRMTAAFLTMNQRALVLNEIGTGKTEAALWAADYLMDAGLVKKALIISPLSTLERVWGDAIFTNFHHRKGVTLHGTAKRRHKLLNTDVNFYIINHDGFSIISDETIGMFDLVIIDEVAVYRNPSTTRFRLMRKWLAANPTVRLWMMTGTPTPNAPTDAWTLAKMVNSPYVPRTYTAFRDLTMSKLGQHSWVPRPGSLDTVKQVLQPAVRYTRDDCFDLPSTVFQTREVALTKEQRTHYDTMMRHFITDAANGEQITAVNEAVKLQKLVQIACGVAYDDKGNNVEINCKPRIQATMEIIDEVGGKVIVFVPLTGTLHMLERELSKRWSVAVVNGAVSTTKRNKIFHDFQNAKDPHVIVAHPGTMAHGLTLTAASTIIWYGPITSNEQYVQANGRIERIGKTHSSNVVHIGATTLERKMFQRLKMKQRLQGLLLDMIQAETED
jgi:SNF2 family DNA or RNA helicase|tara:strand:+ start:369 stop:1919 length:1551 start_codon:yes stop_codon:yes gene_type:complete